MSCHVEGKSLADAASLSHDAQFGINDTAAAITVKDKVVAFFFHRQMFFTSFLLFPAMTDDDFRYWMQRHNELHLCLLSLLTDILLSVRCRLDMLVFQILHI